MLVSPPTANNKQHDRDLIANSAAEWEALLPAGSSIEVVNAHKVIATVPTDAAADAAAVLAEQDEVHWIEAKEVMFELNKHAASYLQGGTVAVAATPGTHPIWAAGLTGLNQIVGVGDSGLDAEMCYFSDPNGEQLAMYVLFCLIGVFVCVFVCGFVCVSVCVCLCFVFCVCIRV